MAKSKYGILNVFRENLGIKIGSLILAFSIWWFVSSQQEGEVSFDVPLRIINIPRGLILTSKSAPTIQVTVRGLTNALNLLTANQIRTTIELEPDVKPGNILYQLQPKEIDVPEGFTVSKLSPSIVELSLEKEVIRVVPINLSVKGIPSEGYELGQTYVNPSSVRISGPTSSVKDLEAIYTESIDISEKSLAWEARTNLVAPSNLINFLDKKTVDVRIQFVEKMVEITLPMYEYQKITTNPATIFEPENIIITLKGPELKVKQLQGNPSKDLIISVDASNLKPGKHQVVPQIILVPPDVQILSIDPKKIKVTVSKPSPP